MSSFVGLGVGAVYKTLLWGSIFERRFLTRGVESDRISVDKHAIQISCRPFEARSERIDHGGKQLSVKQTACRGLKCRTSEAFSMKPISRREFVALTTAVPVAIPAILQGRAAPTAQEVVDRIKQRIGIEWKADGVDGFKGGDPMTPVKGVATTAMASLDVLKQAVKAGANFVITCEPTFYSRADTPAPTGARRGGPVAPDAIFTAKNEFIRNNQLVVWRFSDHWRQRTPDPLSVGLADTLGWGRLRAQDDPRRITIPGTTLESLASDLKRKLNSRGGIRVVGDPRLRVSKIALLPGTSPVQSALGLFPLVDAIIAGEVREWESVELARDKVTAGERKSLILLGRVVSENPGMSECAKWLKDVVPEVRTTWIPVDDPYWRPV